eukprot:gene1439-1564_t
MIMHELIFLLAFLCMVSSYRSLPKARCSLNGIGRLSPLGTQSSDWVDLTADGGVKKKVLTPGTDKLVEAGDIIAASFSASVKGQPTPFSRNDKAKFTYKDGNAIKGWDIAVGSMKVGEKAQFSVSSNYGYGVKGVGKVIPANADLEFQINVLATLGNELQPESLFQKDLNVDPFLAQTPEAIQAEYDKLQARKSDRFKGNIFDIYLRRLSNISFGFAGSNFFASQSGERPPWYLNPNLTFPAMIAFVVAAFVVVLSSGGVKEKGIPMNDIDLAIISIDKDSRITAV